MHLNDLVWRDGGRDAFSTLGFLPDPHCGATRPVCGLTSPRTFSGAEEFSYDLRNLKPATLFGETTGGGANPGGDHRLNKNFSMFVPSGRAINPITGTRWEGYRVETHLKVVAADASRVVQLQALTAMLAGTAEKNEQTALQTLVAELEQAAPTDR